MFVFRITKSAYAKDLTGTGAKLHGGRWNSKGIPIVYTSETRALATLELLAHIPYPSVPNDFVLITMEIPDQLTFQSISTELLPHNWFAFPHSESTRSIGNKWFNSGESVLLRVPSAIIKDEHNFLLNPMHPDFKFVNIVEKEPFEMDKRILW